MKFTKLPKRGTFTLYEDVLVDGADLQRFIDAGGTIDTDGNQIFVDDKIGKKTIARTVDNKTITIEGPTLTVKPSVEIVGAHPDGSGGRGFGIAVLCPNCGLSTHVRCCAWCGQKHKPKRYQNDHCSAKCEKEAARWDKGSAALQEEYDAQDDSEDP